MLKALLIGNLGRDPELKHSPEGRPTLRFTVACNYRVRNPDGAWADATEWVRVTVFGNRTEALAQQLRKGSRVYVDGRLEARSWTDRQQQLHAGLEVIADEVQLAGPRGDDRLTSAPAVERPPPPADEAELEDLPF